MTPEERQRAIQRRHDRTVPAPAPVRRPDRGG
jgi:hypothetical protein